MKITAAIIIRPDGRKLTRLALPGRDADEWGVKPDLGLTLILPEREREVLRRRLDERSRLYPANRIAH